MNVVIAEDDYRVALLHEQHVKKFSSINVVGRALNGEELKRLLTREEVHLILLDIYFPDILGTELLPYIRQNYPQVDIIIITASDNRQHLQIAKRYGVYQYLLKPLSMDDFIQTIEQYIKDSHWFKQSGGFQAEDTLHVLSGSKKKGEISEGKWTDLPSGIDSITLGKIRDALLENKDGVTIDAMCDLVGISRTTARRYLEYIVSEGQAITRLNYGVIGRPERKYVIA